MKTITVAICEGCEEQIRPDEGYIFHGNVYLITKNIDDRAGLIGNNIFEDEIKEVSYCKRCTCEILSIQTSITK